MQKLSWSKLNRKLKGFYFSDVGRTLAELVYWRCNHSKKQWLKGNKFFKIWIVEHYLRYIQNPLKILPQTTTGSFPPFVEKKNSTSVQTKND